MDKVFSIFQWVKKISVLLLVILLCSILIIELHTATAAKFTDNVLRPIFGSQVIIFVEKIYFNSSDAIKRIIWPKKIGISPFADRESEASLLETNLDLTPIPINANLKSIPNEGIWKNWPLHIFPNKQVMAYSFLRSDPERPFSTTTLLQIDTDSIGIGSVAGTKEPGSSVGKPGSGTIPEHILKNSLLVAAFNGGFQYKDGAYGMIVEGTTYLPLKRDLGTLVSYQDGSLKIFPYEGQSIEKEVVFIRQNCPMLIQNSQIIPDTQEGRSLWNKLSAGTSQTLTWRSGLGINSRGHLIFAVGNNLSPSTLAKALKSAGSIDAIQLDINQTWVRFNIFDTQGNGNYTSTPLNKYLHDGGDEYLKGYHKDFFYLYKK